MNKCEIKLLEEDGHCWRQYCEKHDCHFYTLLKYPGNCPMEEGSHIEIIEESPTEWLEKYKPWILDDIKGEQLR